MDPLPRTVRLVIFDLDGVVYRGADAVPGIVELVAQLHAAGTRVRFATNNSMVERAGYVDRLAQMGIPAVREEIVTSTSATVEHLRRSDAPYRRLMAVGAPGMIAELTAAGYEATAAADGAPDGYAGAPLSERYDAVVVGLDPQFDYHRLAAAAAAIRAGARFIATNADRRYPTAVGFVPGAGSMVAAIAAASDVEPEVIGKPAPAMFEATVASAGIPPSEAVVIGDNPDADVVAAHRAGIASILVLTGVADAAMVASLEGERVPDAIADGPPEVAALLAPRLTA